MARIPFLRLAATVIGILALLTFCGCRKEASTPAGEQPIDSDGPSQYAATVLVTVEEDELPLAVHESRIIVMDALRLEEFSKPDGSVMRTIFRPDIDRLFVLSVGNRVYTEAVLFPGAGAAGMAVEGGSNSKAVGVSDNSPSIQEDDIQNAPTRVEENRLSKKTIDGHECTVAERRSIFADGLTETVRTYRAADLGGLALRVEMESVAGADRTRITTERRDVRTQVLAAEFEVPSDFKRVNRID